MKKPSPPRVAFLCSLVLAFSSNAEAQEILNPSFEATNLEQAGAPFLSGGAASEAAVPWSFGALAGICIDNMAYAESIEAADGKQVAFIQSDPALALGDAQTIPQGVLGVDITGLESGTDYEIQWSQASRASDVSHGAITVILTDPANPANNLTLVEQLPVTNKNAWNVEKQNFTAKAATMRLNFLHSVPSLGNEGVGTESTLLDDFRIQKLK